MAKKRSTPTPGSGRDTKKQAGPALPSAAQVRERDRRRAARRARSAQLAAELSSMDDNAPRPEAQPPPTPEPPVANTDTTTVPVERPEPSPAKREVDRLESEIRSWLLSSLEPVSGAEPDAPSGSSRETPVSTAEPTSDREPDDAAGTSVEPAPAELEVRQVLDDDTGDAHQQIEGAPEADPAGQQAPVEQRTRANGVRPAAATEASPSRAPVPVRGHGTVIPSAPYQPPAWVAEALVEDAGVEVVGRVLRERSGSPQTDTEREPRRRGLVVGVFVLLVTAVALAAIVWQVIAIGRADDSPSTSAGSGATQTPLGQQSAVMITSRGQLDGVMHLVLQHPASSIRLRVLMPAAGTSTADFDPIVRQLTLTVDGRQIKTVGRDLQSGDKLTLPLPPGTRTADLSYHAVGVMMRNEPSIAGRALVLVTPLIVNPTYDLYGTISVHSPAVTNVGCSVAGGPLTTCGTKIPDGWRVTAPPGQGGVNVLAQITLPAS
ncbi:MAG: hypothetical protein ABJA86_12820 [Nocardioidaceae bacterium]